MHDDWVTVRANELVDEYEWHGGRLVPHVQRDIGLLLMTDDPSVIDEWLRLRLSERESGFDLEFFERRRLGDIVFERDVYRAFTVLRARYPASCPRTVRQLIWLLNEQGGAFARLAVAMPPPCPECEMDSMRDVLRLPYK